MPVTRKIEERTYELALRIIHLVRALPKDDASQIVGRQVLRSGTGIGVNVEEATPALRQAQRGARVGASSKRDFANKMSIACREARETYYWLRLIRDSNMIGAKRIELLIQELLELTKILSKTVSTARKRLAVQ
jgi:four helix bundle protein